MQGRVSRNHSMAEVGRDSLRSSDPAPLLSRVTQDGIQAGLDLLGFNLQAFILVSLGIC